MDRIRTPYHRRACLDPDCTFRVTLRWYPARPGAKVFPGPHLFGSGDWSSADPHDPWEGPGELKSARREFYAGVGSMFKYSANGVFCGDPEWFRTGVPLSAIAAALANPPAMCAGALSVDNGPPWVMDPCGENCWPNPQCPPSPILGRAGVKSAVRGAVLAPLPCGARPVAVAVGTTTALCAPTPVPGRAPALVGASGVAVPGYGPGLLSRSAGVAPGVFGTVYPCCGCELRPVPVAVQASAALLPCCADQVGAAALEVATHTTATYAPPPGCAGPPCCGCPSTPACYLLTLPALAGNCSINGLPCADSAGTYHLDQNTACSYRSRSADNPHCCSGSMPVVLFCDGSNWTLKVSPFLAGPSAGAVYTHPVAGYDCLGCNLFALASASGDCTGYPATLTLCPC